VSRCTGVITTRFKRIYPVLNLLNFTVVDYILDSYIKNNADFLPEIWLEYLSSTLRTINNSKSFHGN
jgi:hypothetical protein